MRRFWRAATMMWLAVVLALGAGCTNLRYYTTYRYEPVRKEKERAPIKEVEYLSGLFQEGGSW
ncbi:MAG: hypothetical protein RBU30_18100, partial [Polyangia bacterium]|nr:hypothetical protein [Polyangia bacterium]